MKSNNIIENALNEDVELSKEEYAERKAKADAVTAAHGFEGEAPLSEEERERRMRMNYYGSSLNVLCAILGAIDNLANILTTLNNNIVNLAGGGADGGVHTADTGE